MLNINSHKDLIRKIAANDQQAFEELYKLYHLKVFNTGISYLQNHHDAEEVTQNVFVEIYGAASKFEGKSSVSTWIYRITINKCLDFIKHKKRKKRFALITRLFGQDDNEPIDLPDFEHPGILMEKKEDARLLFMCIATLPEQQKNAFILSYVEDLPRQEVADVMNTSLKSVESLLQRAKVSLRNRLEKFYPERRKK